MPRSTRRRGNVSPETTAHPNAPEPPGSKPKYVPRSFIMCPPPPLKGQPPIIRRHVALLILITAEPQSSSPVFSSTYHFHAHPAIQFSPYFQSDEIWRSSIREPIQPSRHTGPR